MITCPNCAHANPDTAVECEACYTPLPAMIDCPSCGAKVSAAAHFCGQCGHDLQHEQAQPHPSAQPPAPPAHSLAPTIIGAGAETGTVAETSMPQQSVPAESVSLPPDVPPALAVPPIPEGASAPIEAVNSQPAPDLSNPTAQPEAALPQKPPDLPPEIPSDAGDVSVPESAQLPSNLNASTRLQQTAARLFHIQSNNVIELPLHLNVIHMGKPNGQIPPDIDLSGVADSDIVSRVHADIRVEGDAFYLEDLGSSNGTYVNNLPLQKGDRHRLRPGDRIAFGKGDKVSFLFQFS
jgi:hypothetical protein